MPPAHTHGMLRKCGATTVVTGQSFVHIDGQLWAVENDKNTHLHGELIASNSGIYINGKRVIAHTPDHAQPDDAGHINPETDTDEGSGFVFVY